MAKYILENAGDINWMAIFALLTFFTMFVISVVTVFGKSRAFVDRVAHMPLEDDGDTSNS